MEIILHYLFLASIVFDGTVISWVLRNGQKQKIARLYGIVFFVMFIWKLSMLLVFYGPTAPRFALFIDQVSFSFGSLLTFALLYFTWQLTEEQFLSRRIVQTVGVINCVFAVLCFAGRLIVGTREYFSVDPFTALVIPGPLAFWFYLFTLPPLFLTLYVVIQGFRRCTGIMQLRIGIVGFALCFAFIFGIVTNVFIPLFFKFLLSDTTFSASTFYSVMQIVGAITLSLISGSTAYAITRYRFMDIRVVFKKSFIYGFGMCAGFFGYFVFLYACFVQAHSLFVWL